MGVLSTIGTVATIAAAAASMASMGYAAAQGAPSIPGNTSSEVSWAQTQALPYQRMLAAAEQEGGRALNYGYTQQSYSPQQAQQMRQQLQQQISQAQQQIDQWGSGQTQAPGAASALSGLRNNLTTLQAQLAAVPQGGGTIYRDPQGNLVPQSAATQNFAGAGLADIEGQLAGRMADNQIALSQKYGEDYARLATQEAMQSDPLGFAARDKELSMIQNELKNPMPVNPLATTLDSQVAARVNAGSGLDDMSRQLLDQEMAKAAADRGGTGPSANQVAGEMSTGMSGAQRLQAAEQAGQGWVGSGATPADVEYRRQQQDLADLASFVNGMTPQAQFRNISGASQGATPQYYGQQMPTMAGGAAQAGPAYGVSAWQQQLRGLGGQANSWMAGLSGLLSGVGGAVNAMPSGG